MPGQNIMEEIDCGSFFDQIDDLLDFPGDDVEAGLPPIDHDSFPSFWSDQPQSLPGSGCGSGSGAGSVFEAHPDSDLSAHLSVPYEDIVQMEWLSNLMDDSFSSDPLTIDDQDPSKAQPVSRAQFQTSSPISVLDSSSSCTDEKAAPRSPEAINLARCGRARSKRPRPATYNPRPPVQLISPTSSVGENPQPVDSESHVESRPVIKIPRQVNPEQKKKKKIKFTMSTAAAAAASASADTSQSSATAQAVRKCMHCEITKTPQWRAGPMGPKTLCNACGVRYKSGRLFPEYRPAASPTFIPSLHSNSHKKVLEMRSNVGDPDAMANPPELIPNRAVEMEYM